MDQRRVLVLFCSSLASLQICAFCAALKRMSWKLTASCWYCLTKAGTRRLSSNCSDCHESSASGVRRWRLAMLARLLACSLARTAKKSLCNPRQGGPSDLSSCRWTTLDSGVGLEVRCSAVSLQNFLGQRKVFRLYYPGISLPFNM
eukprot:scaffold1026_cov272-Pinguiococcus_pyrenoidosus.AAC.16